MSHGFLRATTIIWCGAQLPRQHRLLKTLSLLELLYWLHWIQKAEHTLHLLMQLPTARLLWCFWAIFVVLSIKNPLIGKIRRLYCLIMRLIIPVRKPESIWGRCSWKWCFLLHIAIPLLQLSCFLEASKKASCIHSMNLLGKSKLLFSILIL